MLVRYSINYTVQNVAFSLTRKQKEADHISLHRIDKLLVSVRSTAGMCAVDKNGLVLLKLG
jgi:hypothetical protein